MVRFIEPKSRSETPHTVSIHLNNWMLSEIDSLTSNRSKFIREAVKEYMVKNCFMSEIPQGKTTLTFFPQDDNLIIDMNKMVIKGFEMSRCELVRNALREKFRELDIIKKKEIKEQTIKVPKGYTYIEGFNGNIPFKTRRLE